MLIEWKYLSLALTLIVVGGIAVVRRYLQRRPRSTVRVPGCDLLARTALEWVPVRNVPSAAVVLWITISFVLGIVFPYLYQRISNSTESCFFFQNPYGLLTSLNYTVMVPILLGSYLLLLSTASRLLETSQLKQLGLARQSTWRAPGVFRQATYHSMFISVCLGIQYQAICSVEWAPGPCCPWVLDFEESARLNWVGALYYALRGLNTYMALGLFMSTGVLWWIITQQLECRDPRALLTRAFRVEPCIKGLGTTLLVTTMVATMVVTVHGLALVAQASIQDENLVDLFGKSTWVWFLLFNLTGFVFVGASLYWIHYRLLVAVQANEDTEMDKIDSRFPIGSADDSENVGDDDDVKGLATYWETRARVHEEMGTIETWPLPTGGKATAIITLGVQAFNVIGAAVALWPK